MAHVYLLVAVAAAAALAGCGSTAPQPPAGGVSDVAKAAAGTRHDWSTLGLPSQKAPVEWRAFPAMLKALKGSRVQQPTEQRTMHWRPLAAREGVRLAVSAGTDEEICLRDRINGVGGGGSGCTTVDDDLRDGRKLTGSMPYGPRSWQRRRYIAMLASDAVHDVRLTRGTRTVRRLAVVDNTIIARAHQATELRWRDKNGRPHRMTIR